MAKVLTTCFPSVSRGTVRNKKDPNEESPLSIWFPKIPPFQATTQNTSLPITLLHLSNLIIHILYLCTWSIVQGQSGLYSLQIHAVIWMQHSQLYEPLSLSHTHQSIPHSGSQAKPQHPQVYWIILPIKRYNKIRSFAFPSSSQWTFF